MDWGNVLPQDRERERERLMGVAMKWGSTAYLMSLYIYSSS